MALVNRRRRRRHSFMYNRRRRHYRRNPAIFSKARNMIPSIQPVLYAGAGFVGSHALEYFLTAPGTDASGAATAPLIPVSITGSSIGKYAVRLGCVIATAYLAKLVAGGDKARMVGIGGGVYFLTSAAKEFMPASVSPYLASYKPIANLGGLRAYRPLAAPRVVPFGLPSVVGLGNAGIDQERFNRF